jgi:DNA replication protein DnaC
MVSDDDGIKSGSELMQKSMSFFERAVADIEEAKKDPTKAVCDKHDTIYEPGSEDNKTCWMCDHEAKAAKEAEWKRRESIKEKLQELELGFRFNGKTFADYVVENEGQKKALSVATGIVERYESFFKKGTQVLFCGKSGTGKTMLTAIIAQELVKAEYQVRVTTVQKMIRRVRETFGTKENEQDIVDEFSYFPLLIIDEVGVSLQSDYEKTILFEIMDERYKYERPTIMTSNLDAEEVEKYLGFRLMRRFRDSNGLMVPFEWEEYRGNR